MVKFLKTSKALKRNKLMDLLHANMGMIEQPRGFSSLHASSVTRPDFCPRKIWLMIQLDKKEKGGYIDPALHYTFDEGRDKQARFNNVWMRKHHVGHWRCRGCGTLVTECKVPTESICLCNFASKWEYEEVVFKDPLTKIQGSIDSILDVGDPLYLAVECKIVKGEEFKLLAGPMAEHRLRTQLYLYLIEKSPNGLSKKIDTQRAHVLYMCRGHGYKHETYGISPFKDFVVERDDSQIIERVNRAYVLTYSMKEKRVPAGICDSLACKYVASCPVAKECFSTNPPNVSWMKNEAPAHVGLDVVDVRQ